MRRQRRQESPDQARAPEWKKATKLSAFVAGDGQPLFNPGVDHFQQAGVFQIRAGVVVGKFPALCGPGLMDGAAFAHPVVGQQDA